MERDFDDEFGDVFDGLGFGAPGEPAGGARGEPAGDAPAEPARTSRPEPPGGFRWHDTEPFGFAVAVPRRFRLIANTVDPIAAMWRGRAGRPDDRPVPSGGGRGGGEDTEDAPDRKQWPAGLWDPEVVGELAGGRLQPFRLLEFDAIGGRDEPLPDDRAAEMWFQARQMFPMSLESARLPGYKLLDIHDTTLGPHDALAFEYRWDGLRPDEDGGDHAVLFWVPSPWIVFHVYYHCSEDQWEARLPELGLIASTFRVLDEDEE